MTYVYVINNRIVGQGNSIQAIEKNIDRGIFPVGGVIMKMPEFLMGK